MNFNFMTTIVAMEMTMVDKMRSSNARLNRVRYIILNRFCRLLLEVLILSIIMMKQSLHETKYFFYSYCLH